MEGGPLNSPPCSAPPRPPPKLLSDAALAEYVEGTGVRRGAGTCASCCACCAALRALRGADAARVRSWWWWWWDVGWEGGLRVCGAGCCSVVLGVEVALCRLTLTTLGVFARADWGPALSWCLRVCVGKVNKVSQTDMRFVVVNCH